MSMTNLAPWQWFRKERTPAVHGMGANPMSRPDPVSRFHDEVNRLFDSFFQDAGWTFSRDLAPGAANGNGLASMLWPQLDIAESGKHYTVSAELPGVSRDDMDLTVQDDTLVISGQKKRESREDSEEFHRVERSFGRFQRTLTLPADADTDNIAADFVDGVLTVTIPRREGVESSRGKRIAIGNGK